jgi:transcriptional regulator with XRE-family HTH domain
MRVNASLCNSGEDFQMATVKKQYFLDLMTSRKFSMRGLAKKLGMGHSQLSLMLSGDRKMQLEEAAKLSQIFGVPLHEIALAAGVNTRPVSGKRVHVIGFAGADGNVTLNPKDVVERTDAPPNMPDTCVAVQIRATEGQNAWANGWLAFLIPNDEVDLNSIERLSFCKIKDGPIVVATVRRGYHPSTFNLSGFVSRTNVVLDSATPVLLIRP